MHRHEVDELTKRLQRVERRVLVMSAGWLLSVVLLLVLWAGTPRASSQISAGVFKVRGLAILDQNDRSRLFFGISDQGNAGAWVYDTAGKTRIHFGVDFGKVPEIWFGDESGNERLHLGLADADGRSKLTPPSPGLPQVRLFYDPSGPARLGLYDGSGERIAIGGNGRGDQGIWVFDASGRAVWSAPHGIFGGVKP